MSNYWMVASAAVGGTQFERYCICDGVLLLLDYDDQNARQRDFVLPNYE